VGLVSGSVGYITAMAVPAACYVVLSLFAMKAGKTAPVHAVTAQSAH
jgi:hypothetical protein